MDAIRELKAQRAKAFADADVLMYQPDGNPVELTEESRAVVDGLLSNVQRMDAEIEVLEADEKRFVALQTAKARQTKINERQTHGIISPMADVAERTIPATARRYSSLRAFKGPNADLQAYRFGTWFAGIRGIDWAVSRCRDQGISLKRTAGEGVNTAGGFLVPDEFEQTLIDLRESYGVFRANARPEPMASDSKVIMRRTGGLTPYFVGESEAGTESTKSWDRITLVARKCMVLAVYSNELNEDAIINIGDDLANEIAYAFALKEDQCGFLGDGSGTYGGILGVGPALVALNGVDEGGGIIVGTGNLPSELVIGDWSKVPALLPQYAAAGDCKWYMHRNTWGLGVERLMIALAGNNWSDVQNGGSQSFLGYPVVISQVMQYSSAGGMSEVLALFGDLGKAVTFGTRRGITIGFSDAALNAFEQDELVIRGTERFDINVHDIGTATAGGPIVALIGKAS